MRYTTTELQELIKREITVYLWGRDVAALVDEGSPLMSNLSLAIAEFLVNHQVEACKDL